MPDHMGEVPSRGCEVFVGKIPRDLFEDEIFPVFEKIGPIYELRLMMDFDGRNRGFCFVMFTKVGFPIHLRLLTKLSFELPASPVKPSHWPIDWLI